LREISTRRSPLCLRTPQPDLPLARLARSLRQIVT
jgi:hypothetical protein